MIRLIAVAVAALVSSSAFAFEGPPYAGPYDDVTYGDIAHASFDVQLPRPDGVSVVGSQFDDARYAPASERPATRKSDRRVAQAIACGCHAS